MNMKMALLWIGVQDHCDVQPLQNDVGYRLSHYYHTFSIFGTIEMGSFQHGFDICRATTTTTTHRLLWDVLWQAH